MAQPQRGWGGEEGEAERGGGRGRERGREGGRERGRKRGRERKVYIFHKQSKHGFLYKMVAQNTYKVKAINAW